MSNLDYFKQFAKAKEEVIIPSKVVWIYTRVSSKEQFDHNNSVERQERESRLFATKNDYVVTKIFGGTYESAKKDFTRKEFMKMIDEVRSVKIKPYAILIYKMSRFSRSGGNAVGIVNELVDNLGVHLIEISSGIDTSTDMGKLSVYNSLLAAHKENLDRKEITYGGMKDYVKKGLCLGNAPMGYDHYGRRVRNPKFFAPEQRIVINETGKALKKAWHWKAEEGLPDSEIIKQLGKLYSVKMYAQKLSKMWRNPFYCGVGINKLTDGEPVKGKWEAMISVDIFKRVQDIINNKPKHSKPCKNHSVRPLAGFLVCCNCSRKMTGYENKKKKIHYYKCQKCRGVSLNAETTPKALHKGANQMFLDLLSEYKLNPQAYLPFKKQFKAYYKYLTGEDRERLNQAEKQLKERQNELFGLKRNYALGKIKESEEFYEKLKDELEKEIVDLQVKCNHVPEQISNLDILLDKSLKTLENINEMWVSTDIRNKKEIQNILFPEGIVYNSKKREYLTKRLNEYFELAALFSRDYEENKKGNIGYFSDNSLIVARRGIEPLFPG